MQNAEKHVNSNTMKLPKLSFRFVYFLPAFLALFKTL